MPYGIADAAGGDSPENDAKMVRCIADVRAKGASKLSAILICKTAIQKGAAKK